MKAEDDTYVATGCPGGPGHPGAVSLQLIDAAVDDIVRAAKDGRFDSDLKPRLLPVCQCHLAGIIGRLARKVADANATIDAYSTLDREGL